MAESNMINFRATDSEKAQIDQAAKALGVSRSDLIKAAVKQYIGGVTPKPAVPAPAKTGPVCVTGNVPSASCRKAVWVKLQGGVKLCQVCQATRT